MKTLYFVLDWEVPQRVKTYKLFERDRCWKSLWTPRIIGAWRLADPSRGRLLEDYREHSIP